MMCLGGKFRPRLVADLERVAKPFVVTSSVRTPLRSAEHCRNGGAHFYGTDAAVGIASPPQAEQVADGPELRHRDRPRVLGKELVGDERAVGAASDSRR